MLTTCTSGCELEDELEDDELDDDEGLAPFPPFPPFPPLPPLPPLLAVLPPFPPPAPLPDDPFEADEFPEPDADPVAEVPPLPLLASCSPTVTLTCDTKPSNVAMSEAPFSAVWALVSWSFAAATLSSSTASRWADDPDD